jgi:hypothetical protein
VKHLTILSIALANSQNTKCNRELGHGEDLSPDVCTLLPPKSLSHRRPKKSHTITTRNSTQPSPCAIQLKPSPPPSHAAAHQHSNTILNPRFPQLCQTPALITLASSLQRPRRACVRAGGASQPRLAQVMRSITAQLFNLAAMRWDGGMVA